MVAPHERLAGRWLQRLAGRLCDHPWRYCLPQLVLVVMCIAYAASQLQFSTDRSDLVSTEVAYRRNFLELKQEFGLPEALVVAVESESRAKNRQFVERLAARLHHETNLITRVFFKGDLKLMGPKALMFLPEDALEGFHRGLQNHRELIEVFSRGRTLSEPFELVNQRFRSLRTASLDSAGEGALLQAFPALQRLVDMISESVAAGDNLAMPGVAVLLGADRGGERYASYISLAGGQVYVLTAAAASPAVEEAAIRRLRELVAETQVEVPGMNVGITGESVLRQDEMAQANLDASAASGLALLLTMAILVVAYYGVLLPVLATTCLVIGICYTLGFATLSVGRMNLLSVTLVPMLIGLSIDFGVHLMSRYEEEVGGGRAPGAALRRALGLTGIGIFTSALTTAGAFFSMMLTDLRGTQQMGLIAGVGLLLSLIPMLTLLPVLLLRVNCAVLDRGRHRQGLWASSSLIQSLACCNWRRRIPGREGGKRARLERTLLKSPWLVLCGGLAFTLATFVYIPEVRFDFNLQNLQTRGLPSVELEKKLVRTGSRSVLSCSVVADTLEDAVVLEERIRRLPSVAEITSLVGLLTEDQDRKLELVRGIKAALARLELPEPDPGPVDLTRLRSALYQTQLYADRSAAWLRTRGERPALQVQLLALHDSVNRLRALVAQDGPELVERLTLFQRSLLGDLRDTVSMIGEQDDRGPVGEEDVPGFLRDRFLSPLGRFRLEVHPREDVWQRAQQEEFVRQLRTVDPNVTGSPVQFYESTSRLKESFQRVALYALGIIALLVFLHFLRIDAMILALLPVLLGYGWMLGLMGWLGIPFNPVNVAALALVLGVGVSNGVHVLNRFVEETNPLVMTRSTGKAVIVSALTTMAGFGSLMIAEHRGIASLGAVMTLGTATCMVAALVFLPTVLNLLGRLGWSLASPQRPRGNA